MNCDGYRSALAEVALGTPASEALEAHLAHCPRCRGVREEDRRLLGRIDDEIQATLRVMPSAGFAARARQRLDEGSTLRWRWWLLPTAAAAATVIVMLRQAEAPLVPRSAPTRAAPERTPLVDAVRPAPAAPPPVRPSGAAVAARLRHRPAAMTSEPPVVIAAEPRAALRLYVESLRRWRVGATPLLTGDLEAAGRPQPLDLPPLELASFGVSPTAREEIDIDPIRIVSIGVQPFTIATGNQE